MNLEAFCRVLPLFVETCGRFFLLVSLLAAETLFLEKEKRLLAAAKNSISDGYLAL